MLDTVPPHQLLPTTTHSKIYDPCRVVGKMKQKGDRYFVDVNVILNAKKLSGPHVIAELMKVNGQWIFMNFRYLDSADLLTNLKTLKKERQTPAK